MSALLAEVVGIGHLFRLIHVPPDLALDLLWYGLYFGVLGRDCAEVASDRMVRGGRGRRRRVCAVVASDCAVSQHGAHALWPGLDLSWSLQWA